MLWSLKTLPTQEEGRQAVYQTQAKTTVVRALAGGSWIRMHPHSTITQRRDVRASLQLSTSIMIRKHDVGPDVLGVFSSTTSHQWPDVLDLPIPSLATINLEDPLLA